MTANQRYKQAKKEGCTLSFADFMTREKKKNFLDFEGNPTPAPVNNGLYAGIQNILDQVHENAGLQTTLNNKYIFGIDSRIWIGVGIAAVAVTSVVLYHKYAQKTKT